MPDETTAPPATVEQPKPAGGESPKPNLLAGKYENRDALNQGIGEAAKKLEMENIDPAHGDDKEAEAVYQTMQRLIRKQGEMGKGDPDEKKEPDTGAPDPGKLEIKKETEKEKSFEQLVDDAGLKISELQQQWADQGKLTDEQYEALKKQGIPKFSVDALGRDWETMRKNVITQAADFVGGAERLKELTENASGALPEDEIDMVNAALNDPNSVKMALAYLEKLNHKPQPGKVYIEGDSGGGGSAPISNAKEYRMAMAAAARGDQAAEKRLLEYSQNSKRRFI